MSGEGTYHKSENKPMTSCLCYQILHKQNRRLRLPSGPPEEVPMWRLRTSFHRVRLRCPHIYPAWYSRKHWSEAFQSTKRSRLQWPARWLQRVVRSPCKRKERSGSLLPRWLAQVKRLRCSHFHSQTTISTKPIQISHCITYLLLPIYLRTLFLPFQWCLLYDEWTLVRLIRLNGCLPAVLSFLLWTSSSYSNLLLLTWEDSYYTFNFIIIAYSVWWQQLKKRLVFIKALHADLVVICTCVSLYHR